MTEREQPSDETQATQAHDHAAQQPAAAAATPLAQPAPAVDHAATTPDRGDRDEQGGGSLSNEHPEVLVGAAFAGGLGLAFLLRLVGRG